jgi:hypothetical protein
MKGGQWRHVGLLFVLALAVRLLTAWPLRQPGYTDAYYYAIGARQLDRGQGFNEPFIWNYLDPPASVPHAGYQYWMPLAAMLGGLGMALLGESFRAMQAPFVLLSALLPLVAYAVAWDLTGKSRYAILAGLLAVFPGFYTHVLVLPDNFAPFALAGSVCLWAAGRGLQDAGGVAGRGRQPAWFGLAGLAAGLGHLARADGILLAGVALVAAAIPGRLPANRSKIGTRNLASLAMVAAGYLLVMGPWFIRNWRAFGTPLAGAGLQTLFLTNYDDLFAYGRPPTLASYLAWGWGPILSSKAEALLLNLQRFWIENLLVFLLPFTALGLWRLRRDRLLWPFFLYLPLLFLAMTIAFTFPGTRGGLFHSGGALMPALFAAVGPGLEIALRWAARRIRGWQARKAWPVFSAALVGLAILLTVFALGRAGVFSGEWNNRDRGYTDIGDWLARQGASEAVVMVGDAPGFAWHTGQRAVAIPNEPLDAILAVAQRYGARYLVLDSARPRTTDALYAGKATVPGLSLRYTTGANDKSWQLYEVIH